MEKPTTAKRSKVEQRKPQETVDGVLEHMIQEGKEIGTGKDGIVFRIDLSLLPASERHLLVEDQVITPDEEVDTMAVKILKIYNPELGDYEFRMQKRAREILSMELRGGVHIPDATKALDHQISLETRNRLNAHGAHLEDKAEIIMMDYVDGLDLGTVMYNFALKQMGHEDDYIADLTYSQKDQLVGQELGFERPDIESAQTTEEKESAQALTFDRNEEKLLKYLKKKGLKLESALFEKVDNAVRALNQNGMFHNDLHKQNVMIDVNGEVYIIDFGRAGEKRKDGIADTLFSKRWKGLSLSEEDEQKQIHAQDLIQVERLQERLQSHPAQKERINAFIFNVIEKGTPVLERELALSRSDDVKFEQFLVMLHIVRESKVHINVINAFIASLDNKGLRPFERNRVQKLRQIGYL